MEWKLPSGWCIVKDKREQLVAFSKIIQVLMFSGRPACAKSFYFALPCFPLNSETLCGFISERTFYRRWRNLFAHMVTMPDARPWNNLDTESMSLHICRILTTAPLTHSNDACHPSVCPSVIWRRHVVARRMPSLALAAVWSLCSWERDFTGGTKWSKLLRLGVYERGKKAEKKGECMIACWSFFFPPYCEVYLSAAPLEGSHSSLTTKDMFSLCENQTLWCTVEKMLFFTANCCLWSVKKALQSPEPAW